MALGCGDNDHGARLLLDFGDEPPVYGRAPFPTDALREGPRLGRIAGLDRMAEQHSDLIAVDLHALDGFGLRPTVEFFVQGAIDEATIPAATRLITDALMVLDVAPDAADTGAPVTYEWRYDPERRVIAGAPAVGTQLLPGTRYTAVPTTDVLCVDGTPVLGP